MNFLNKANDKFESCLSYSAHILMISLQLEIK